jgi:hypothetical protein
VVVLHNQQFWKQRTQLITERLHHATTDNERSVASLAIQQFDPLEDLPLGGLNNYARI